MRFIKNKIIQNTIILFIITNFFGFSSFNNADKTIEDFNLLNVNGNIVSLSKDFPNAKGFMIIFTSNHCPFAKLYPQRMNDLNSKYKYSGVPLIAISSSDTLKFEEDTYSNMVEKSKNENFNFPYLIDTEQSVARNFNAQKTPHAYVIWKENNQWVVKYNGAIDDNGAEPDKVENQYVANAVDALLNGSEVKIKETNSIGCKISYKN